MLEMRSVDLDGPIEQKSSRHSMGENTNNLSTHTTQEDRASVQPKKTHYPTSFWLAFSGLCFTGLISALDGSIVSTALPSIIETLNGGDDYVWVVNVYFLTSAAVQPFYGQMADLWGRRWVMILVTVIFLVGSALCGAAVSMNMLIWARALQGVGAGGINMLVDMIICDLVPMRERGNFIGLLFLFVSVGTAGGPFIGGILTDRSSWRWVFYINLPLGGAALVLLVLFLQVQWKKDLSTAERLRRIDVIGNSILIASTFAILWALTYGGTRYTWSQGNALVPLVAGLAGLVLFFLWEKSPWCRHPVMPPQHFTNRTTVAAFVISFMCMLLAFWTIYFYPLYFQSVLGASATRSGVYLLPMQVAFPIFAAVGGGIVSKSGRYKPVHLVATALIAVVMGLSSVLKKDTHMAAWIVFQVLAGVGLGSMISTTLQAVQAGLPESETASSVGTWSFVRSLGTIWGVSIPAAVFNNRFDQLSSSLDPNIQHLFTRGQAYQHATASFVNSFEPAIQTVIRAAYVDALKRVYQVGIAFGLTTFLIVCLEKEIPLRTELESDFGLKEKRKTEQEVDAVEDAQSGREAES